MLIIETATIILLVIGIIGAGLLISRLIRLLLWLDYHEYHLGVVLVKAVIGTYTLLFATALQSVFFRVTSSRYQEFVSITLVAMFVALSWWGYYNILKWWNRND